MTLNYIWCGERICQARNAGNLVTRSYYDEGEFVTGGPAQPYYYGVDQLGSVRRAFASTTSAPAFGYDPYGNALQAAALPTDFGYAGMFFNAESGLYLTQYRAYDPAVGRWLSRDPLGEESDPAANLYRYVSGDPVSRFDPTGLTDVRNRFRGIDSPFGNRPGEAMGGAGGPSAPGGTPSSWVCRPSQKGEGWRYENPTNPSDWVRSMPGNPESRFPSQREPYVVRHRNHEYLDVRGNPVSGSSPDAHIPLRDFNFFR